MVERSREKRWDKGERERCGTMISYLRICRLLSTGPRTVHPPTPRGSKRMPCGISAAVLRDVMFAAGRGWWSGTHRVRASTCGRRGVGQPLPGLPGLPATPACTLRACQQRWRRCLGSCTTFHSDTATPARTHRGPAGCPRDSSGQDVSWVGSQTTRITATLFPGGRPSAHPSSLHTHTLLGLFPHALRLVEERKTERTARQVRAKSCSVRVEAARVRVKTYTASARAEERCGKEWFR